MFLNKFIMTTSSFRFPFTLALAHMISCSIFCRVVFYIAPKLKFSHAGSVHPQLAWHFFGISALFAVSLLCSNAALESLDVATIQILKALNPAIIYLIGIVSKVEALSARMLSIVLTICLGIFISVRGSPKFHSSGLALQVVSIMADSTRYIRLQGLLQSQHLKLDALNILSVVAPTAAVLLWVPASYFEFLDICSNAVDLHRSLYLVATSCVLACVLNITSNAFIGATSALTMSVAGVMKDVFMITSSVVTFGSSVSPVEGVGFAVTLAASFAYNWTKLQMNSK